MLTLAAGLAAAGCGVDLLLVAKRGLLLREVPSSVRVVELGTGSRIRLLSSLLKLPWPTLRTVSSLLFRNNLPKIIASLPNLVGYLRKQPADVLITSLPNNIIIALWARHTGRLRTKIIACEANTLSKDREHASDFFGDKLPMLVRQWYPRADAIVAVSNGVADDLSIVAGLPRQRITTIYNGIDIERVLGLKDEPLEDAWFAAGSPPVILAVGRLDRQKDYPTLLKAFSLVRARFEARLLILGEGEERGRLQSIIDNLEYRHDVRMPGAERNPFRYMGRARLLVLSSAWEGLPTVLLEALACGCPIVSTDCPSGPREILDRGALGELVPPGDAEALAAAISRTLSSPLNRAPLRARGRAFSVQATVGDYRTLVEEILGCPRQS
jgi:glycosyltransferase involved in cell wall biosynthesis